MIAHVISEISYLIYIPLHLSLFYIYIDICYYFEIYMSKKNSISKGNGNRTTGTAS